DLDDAVGNLSMGWWPGETQHGEQCRGAYDPRSRPHRHVDSRAPEGTGYAATAGRGSIAGRELVKDRLAAASFEDRPRVLHEHLLDVIFFDACLAERRQDVVGDVRVMPLRPGPLLGLFGEHVRPAVGIVREHHLAGIALGAEPGDHLDTLARRQEV